LEQAVGDRKLEGCLVTFASPLKDRGQRRVRVDIRVVARDDVTRDRRNAVGVIAGHRADQIAFVGSASAS
jgi:hypothetical protein